ncbi:MAG TPA: response regulator [Thermoanaerobaculia bacterium]|nr:response regulator [Thermoanaerobaculia bacterium]
MDDDHAIRSLVTTLLTREEYDVDTASDGLEAVLKLGLSEYSLIVLDLMMPLVSGFEILQFLSEQRPAMLQRVVVMTAVGEKDLQGLKGYDAVPVIRKPFDIADLMRAVRNSTGAG